MLIRSSQRVGDQVIRPYTREGLIRSEKIQHMSDPPAEGRRRHEGCSEKIKHVVRLADG